MGITQKNTYEIGVNNDLSNALLNIDLNRIGRDLTVLELDTVLKVSIGSLVETDGSIYVVDTAAETPTGTPADGDYLYFDPAVPGFEWSSTVGSWDATRGGWYNGDKRRCSWQLMSSTTYHGILNSRPGALEIRQIEIGDWDMNTDATKLVTHNLPDRKQVRSAGATIRDDADSVYGDIRGSNSAGTVAGGFTVSAYQSTQIALIRTTGGGFDGVGYSATSFNRGWVTIWYVA